jgi:hypothetical protein
MTIDIAVRNFRGCADARLTCAPIALVGGLNAVGKTSIAQAVGAALSGNALPVAGLRANAAGALVRVGAVTGTVEVGNTEGSCTVEWPAARATTHGAPPVASAYAVGLETIAPPMVAKDRLRVLAEYLHADPTREDLAAALDEAGLDPELVLSRIWPLIEQSGWDGAVTARRDRGAELKGQWRQCTGANYGSRVAASWRPDLGELDESELVTYLHNAQRERDRAMSAQAVSADEHRRVEEEADLVDARQEVLVRVTARVDEYTAAHRTAQEARQALPPTGKQDLVPCPHCGEQILINRVSLVETRYEKPTGPLDGAELNKRRMAIAEADGKVAHAYDDLNEARQQMALADRAVVASEHARERIANWPRATEAGTDIATAEAQLQRAEKRLAEYRSKAEADRLHRLVEGNEIVISLLAADGLRAKKLARVIDVFNAQLGNLCHAAKWQGVRIDDAGNIGYGDRPYNLLSTSEQYRVRAVLALAMAQLDGSNLVVLDGADILDAPSRGQLFALLAEVEIPALVTMTVARREQLPDLAAAELGASFWLAGGVLEPLGERVAA